MKRILSLDVGNSHTKAALLVDEQTGETRSLHFSSHVKALGPEIDPDLKARDPFDGGGFYVQADGQWWAVGAVAEDGERTRVHGVQRYTSREWRILVHAALLAFVPTEADQNRRNFKPEHWLQSQDDLNLYVASPHRDTRGVFSQRIVDSLERTFSSGRKYVEDYRGNHGFVTLKVNKVKTIPEARGALYFTTLNADGSPRKVRGWNNGTGADVFDIGGRTTDVLAFANGEEDDKLSTSEDDGIINIRKRANEEIRPRFDFPNQHNWPDHVIDGALILRSSGVHTLDYGGAVAADVTSEIEDAVTPWLDVFIDQHLIAVQSGAAEYGNVILAGGGADALRPLVERRLQAWKGADRFFGHLIPQQEKTIHPGMYNALGALRWYMARQRRKS